MPVQGSASNNPPPGTQKPTVDNKSSSSSKTDKVDNKPKGILKGKEPALSEDEQLKKNTNLNSRSVGIVASAIDSEDSKVSKGSAYMLTCVDKIDKSQEIKQRGRVTGNQVLQPQTKLRS